MYRSILILLVAIFLVGCRGNINEGNFKRIKRNMSMQEVEGLLGPGKEMTDEEMLDKMKANLENAPPEIQKNAAKLEVQMLRGITGKKWQDGKKVIILFFRDERVQQMFKEGL